MELHRPFMSFLLDHQERNRRTLQFLILMEAIVSAAKYIQYYYQTGQLKDTMGRLGMENVQGEEVLEIDDMANAIVLKYLHDCGRVIHAVSEEMQEMQVLNQEGGRYYVYYDPLDGSSNAKHGLPVGFLFGIAKKSKTNDGHNLRKGRDFICSGMFIIPTGTFTMALKGSGAWRFHIDETMTYVMAEQLPGSSGGGRLVMPEDRSEWELSFNSGNRGTYQRPVKEWLDANESKYAFRYLGSLAADVHRLLGNGGMFLYPAIVNHPDAKKNRPEGKLRLLYEANVVAMLCEEAGGTAVDEQGRAILDIEPTEIHQRTALYVGSKPLVEEITAVLKGTH